MRVWSTLRNCRSPRLHDALAVLLFAALLPARAAAATTPLDGLVVDAGTAEPVPNATASCSWGPAAQDSLSLAVPATGSIAASAPTDAALITCDVSAAGYSTLRTAARRNESGAYHLGKVNLRRVLLADPAHTDTNILHGGADYVKLDFVVRNTEPRALTIPSLRLRLVVPGSSCMDTVPDVTIEAKPAGQVAQEPVATNGTTPWNPTLVQAPLVVHGTINPCRPGRVEVDIAYLLHFSAGGAIRVALLVPSSLPFTTTEGPVTLKLETEPSAAGELLAEVSPGAFISLVPDVHRLARAH